MAENTLAARHFEPLRHRVEECPSWQCEPTFRVAKTPSMTCGELWRVPFLAPKALA